MMEQARYARDLEIMKGLDRQAWAMAFNLPPRRSPTSSADEHAIRIQSNIRRYLAKKVYVDLLYEKLCREQEVLDKKEKQRVQDTFDLLDTLELHEKRKREAFFNQQERNRLDRSAYRIQSVVKFYLKKQKQKQQRALAQLEGSAPLCIPAPFAAQSGKTIARQNPDKS